MAQRDANLLFSDSQGITANAYSTNVIDLEEFLSAGQQELIWLIIRCIANASASGLANGMSIHLCDRADTSFAAIVPGTEDCIVATGPILRTDFVAGKVWSIGVLRSSLKRYLKVFYNCLASNPNAAITLDCEISNEPASDLKIQKMPS